MLPDQNPHDMDGENVGMLGGDGWQHDIALAGADPSVLQNDTVSDFHASGLEPNRDDVAELATRLGGGGAGTMHADVGLPAEQDFTTAEDARTIDRVSAGVAAPYLPGRLPPIALTGEQGSFPT